MAGASFRPTSSPFLSFRSDNKAEKIRLARPAPPFGPHGPSGPPLNFFLTYKTYKKKCFLGFSRSLITILHVLEPFRHS